MTTRWALKIKIFGKKYLKTQLFDTREEAEAQQLLLLEQGKRAADLRIVEVDPYGEEVATS
jgi:hypothetical protein